MTVILDKTLVLGWHDALGCSRTVADTRERPVRWMCLRHGGDEWTLGCPVAVSAALYATEQIARAAGSRDADIAGLRFFMGMWMKALDALNHSLILTEETDASVAIEWVCDWLDAGDGLTEEACEAFNRWTEARS